MTSETLTAEPFVSGLFFGECPRWHDGRLWYSDFFDHAVFSVSPDGERRVEVDFDGEPAGLGWLPDGRLLFNSRLDRDHHAPRGGRHARRARRPEALRHLARQRHGGGLERPGLLGQLRFRPRRPLRRHGRRAAPSPRPRSFASIPTAPATRPPATSSSRTARSSPRTVATLIIAESLGGRLTAFDRAADGTLTNRRVWAALEGIAPDGICLCADGSVWVANAMAAECVRVAEGGEVHERVTTSRNCYACMLGDDDRRTLYLVTAAGQQRRRGAGSARRCAREGADDRARSRPAVNAGGTPPGAVAVAAVAVAMRWQSRWQTRTRSSRTRPGRGDGVGRVAVAVSIAGVIVLIGVMSAAAGRRGGAAPVSAWLWAVRPRWASSPRRPIRGGRPTDTGYAEDLVPLEQRRWPGADRGPPGLPGCHHGHHARRRRALPLRRGDPARCGRGLPAGRTPRPCS